MMETHASIAKFMCCIKTTEQLFNNAANELSTFALVAKHEENETYTCSSMLKKEDRGYSLK